MADYVPLIIIGALAYWEFVLRGGQDLNNLIPQANAASPPTTAGTAPSTTTCQGKDKNGQPCDCPAPTTAAAVVFAYASKKKKSSSKSKSSSGGGSTQTQTKTQTNTGTGCDCSVCGGTSAAPTGTGTKGTGANIWCICQGGKWAQDPTVPTLKCGTIGKTCSATGAAGFASTNDLNSFAGQSMAYEGYGFQALQAYSRRNW